jgi:hypothetical protein
VNWICRGTRAPCSAAGPSRGSGTARRRSARSRRPFPSRR